MSKSTAIAKAEQPQALLPIEDLNEIRELMQANLGPGGVSQFDLEQRRVPAGGGLSWEIQTLDGVESQKELVGVIVHFRNTRKYWKEKYGTGAGGNVPPDCESSDGITGIGYPGGACLGCPLAQRGSATNDKGEPTKGQACRQGRQLFLLRPGAILPDVVNVPTASLKNAQQFSIRLTNEKIPVHGVLVRIGLENDKNSGGIKYSKTTFNSIRRLNENELAQMSEYAKMVKPLLGYVPLDSMRDEEAQSQTAAA